MLRSHKYAYTQKFEKVIFRKFQHSDNLMCFGHIPAAVSPQEGEDSEKLDSLAAPTVRLNVYSAKRKMVAVLWIKNTFLPTLSLTVSALRQKQYMSLHVCVRGSFLHCSNAILQRCGARGERQLFECVCVQKRQWHKDRQCKSHSVAAWVREREKETKTQQLCTAEGRSPLVSAGPTGMHHWREVGFVQLIGPKFLCNTHQRSHSKTSGCTLLFAKVNLKCGAG